MCFTQNSACAIRSYADGFCSYGQLFSAATAPSVWVFVPFFKNANNITSHSLNPTFSTLIIQHSPHTFLRPFQPRQQLFSFASLIMVALNPQAQDFPLQPQPHYFKLPQNAHVETLLFHSPTPIFQRIFTHLLNQPFLIVFQVPAHISRTTNPKNHPAWLFGNPFAL